MRLTLFEITCGETVIHASFDMEQKSLLHGLQEVVDANAKYISAQSTPFVQPEFSNEWSVVSGSFIIGKIKML